MTISVVLPCLNEARTVGACVEVARRALFGLGVEGEVLVADNGSIDGSSEVARAAGARTVLVPTRGYGAALAGGIRAARGLSVVVADADGSYDLTQIPRFVDALRKGADVVVGNRFSGGILPGAMPWKNRWLGNPFLSAVGRSLSGARLRDFHCGFRAFRKSAYEGLGVQGTGMEWASEMIVRAKDSGLYLAEVPVTLRPDGRAGPSHLRPWRDGIRHLEVLFRLAVT